MIITRAPLRITLGGGGTDLPAYYRKFGGDLVTATIDKYIYLAIHETFSPEFILKYSSYERVQSANDVRHPIFREALKLYEVPPKAEIVSFADIPDGTGLGSSSAFTVALLKGLATFTRRSVFTEELAEQACEIEIERLKEPIGKQDQYASAFGGITRFQFHPDDRVTATPLKIDQETLHRLEDNLLLFFTGFNRKASDVLAAHVKRIESLEPQILKNLHFTKELGRVAMEALETGDLEKFASTLHTHWENKRQRSLDMSNSPIDEAYQEARRHGALGGKLIGAGGGGFLMLYVSDPVTVRVAMRNLGLKEVRFRFDFQGATLL